MQVQLVHTKTSDRQRAVPSVVTWPGPAHIPGDISNAGGLIISLLVMHYVLISYTDVTVYVMADNMNTNDIYTWVTKSNNGLIPIPFCDCC